VCVCVCVYVCTKPATLAENIIPDNVQKGLRDKVWKNRVQALDQLKSIISKDASAYPIDGKRISDIQMALSDMYVNLCFFSVFLCAFGFFYLAVIIGQLAQVPSFKDNIVHVIKACMEFTKWFTRFTVQEQQETFSASAMKVLIPDMTEKMGDVKTSTVTKDCLISIAMECKTISPAFLIYHVSASAKNHRNPKVSPHHPHYPFLSPLTSYHIDFVYDLWLRNKLTHFSLSLSTCHTDYAYNLWLHYCVDSFYSVK